MFGSMSKSIDLHPPRTGFEATPGADAAWTVHATHQA